MKCKVASRIIVLTAVFGMVAAGGAYAQQREVGVVAKVVLHDDGGRTEWIDDKIESTTESKRYNASGDLMSRQIFKLDAMGRAQSMDLYNAQNSIIARTRYAYDDFGRAKEQRTYNRRGTLIHQLVYRYDDNGRPMVPEERSMVDPQNRREPTAPMAPLLTPQGKIKQREEAE